MLVGYARISTLDQNLNLQTDALEAAKCDRIFTDKISSAKDNRPGLTAALDHLRAGDTLIVWRLDRLGRSLKELLEIVEALSNRAIDFKSLTENLDTTTSGGKLIFSIMGAIAEFERSLLKERTNAGLASARARGRKGGRPKSISNKKFEIACQLADSTQDSIKQICESLGISKGTYYRRLKELKKNAIA